MTNAQAALIAAATFVHNGAPKRDIYHDAMTVDQLAARWTDNLDRRDARQQATSAPQADEWRESECRTCGTPLVLLGSRWVGRQDGSTHHRMMLASEVYPHEPQPADRL